MRDEGGHCRSRLLAAVSGALVFCFLFPPSSLIPHPSRAAAKVPFEPTEDYYDAKGRGIRAKWEVPNTSVEEGRDLVATLVITGATNPTEVKKPDLKKLKAFDVFTVINVTDPPRKSDDKIVRFVYKLRPRTRTVDQVPALKFRYFNPAAAEDKRFPSTFADSVSITVTEPPRPEPVRMPEADHLFHATTGAEVLRGPFVPCRWAWGAAALFGPLAALGWFLVWRRIYPNAARLAQMRRSRAARRAIDAVRRSGRTPDPPATIASALLGYLRTLFPVPESAVTPPEIASALVEARVPARVAEQIADVFRACDRARFAPPGDSGLSLAAKAESVITRLEERA